MINLCMAFRTENASRQRKTGNQSSPTAGVETTSSRKPIDLVRCPECNAIVRSGRLTKHQRKVHRLHEPEGAAIVPRPAVSRLPAPGLVPCPSCGVPVRADRLGRHIRGAHPRPPAGPIEGYERVSKPFSGSVGLYRPKLSIFSDNRWTARAPYQGGRADSNRRRH